MDNILTIFIAVMAIVWSVIIAWFGIRYSDYNKRRRNHHNELLNGCIIPLTHIYTKFNLDLGLSINVVKEQSIGCPIEQLPEWSNISEHFNARKYRNLKNQFLILFSQLKEHNEILLEVREDTLQQIEQLVPNEEGIDYFLPGIFNTLYQHIRNNISFDNNLKDSRGDRWNVSFTGLSPEEYVIVQSENRLEINTVTTTLSQLLTNQDLTNNINKLIDKRNEIENQINRVMEILEPIKIHLEKGGLLSGKCYVEKVM